jgi:hypothetical protein
MKKNKKFELLNTINCEDRNSWQDKLFLTFDIDWAHDQIIEDVLQLLGQYTVPATIFATHKTKILSSCSLPKDRVEIGLHPNFNHLLLSESNEKNFSSVCSDLKEIYPNATSVRSHSLCFGSLIQTAYKALGITHDSSVIVPYQDNNFKLFPWKMWDGLVRVPYFFCDYVTSMTTDAPINNLASRKGLKVFDFHPIHVFLNTESLERYQRTRPFHHDPNELRKHRFPGYGTRNRLIELLQMAK